MVGETTKPVDPELDARIEATIARVDAEAGIVSQPEPIHDDKAKMEVTQLDTQHDTKANIAPSAGAQTLPAEVSPVVQGKSTMHTLRDSSF
jgi:uncharacterized lipoprotein YmbA